MLKVGWERNILIKKPTPKKMALTRLIFPNVPFNWEFYEFVGNDDKSFVGSKN
jgi:hypothetical protein